MESTPTATPAGFPSPPPLSWPPPGLERLQGKLWRVSGVAWIGAVIVVFPLLWALATNQPFWSLGPFGGDWQVGLAIALLGLVVLVWAFWSSFAFLRQAAAAADSGYGTLTILEVAADLSRDTGFLIQGRRHFSTLDPSTRSGMVQARLQGAVLVLAAAVWLAVGFGLAVLLAARGFVTPEGTWLLTLGPTAVLLVGGLLVLLVQQARVRSARTTWRAQEGPERSEDEAAAWAERLDQAGEAVVLGAGRKGEGRRFRLGASLVVVLFLLALIPTLTVAVTSAIGPVLAKIAVPSFLPVQQMAGATEVLRRYRLEPDPSITPLRAGAALQNIAFVGTSGTPDALEHPPETLYKEPWFPHPDVFPDPFSETVATDLVTRPLKSFSPDQQAALRQAAEHPAHKEFALLARARLVDVVSGRWRLPFPDSLDFQSLPWPRFAAFRTAGLAQVARAAVLLDEGHADQAEETLHELISTGFLLIDQGPTLIDNLMGVVLANMGGDALEALYRRRGRTQEADALDWARQVGKTAARKARAGDTGEDVHSLLQGIPTLVEQSDALRGLRWEYFATFNTLAPCINLHKMVFGPDETYEDWRLAARDSLVRVKGERDLFELAEGSVVSAGGRHRELSGFVPRFLGMMLGSGGSPGSCASVISSFESGGATQ
jgi:hypothetical protein